MKIKKTHFLMIIFLLTLAFRLYFSVQTPHYSDDSAYYNLRYIEHIKETFQPMFYDELSYGGKESYYFPLFHYLLAVLSFLPFAYKLVPALLIASLVFVAYLIALKITEDKNAALFAALMTSFLPVIINNTLNQISIYSLILPLTFYMLYCLIRIEEKRFLRHFVILCFVLPLLHPITLLFVLSLVFYLMISNLEYLKITNIRKEAILFLIFVTLIIEFIIFKKALLALGFSIIWQNIPGQVLADYLVNVNLIDLIYQIGIFPFLFGIIAILFGIFRTKKNSIILLTSIILSTLFLLSFKLIAFPVGMMFLGTTLAISSALTFEKFFKYIKLTKLSGLGVYIKLGLLVLVLFTLIGPSYLSARDVIRDTVSDDEIKALKTLDKEADEDAVVLSALDESHLITAIAKRRNVMDRNFIFTPEIDRRYYAVEKIYTTNFGVKALELLKKYGITYIYLSPKTKRIYNIEGLSYADEKCFRRVTKVGEVEVFKVRC